MCVLLLSIKCVIQNKWILIELVIEVRFEDIFIVSTYSNPILLDTDPNRSYERGRK